MKKIAGYLSLLMLICSLLVMVYFHYGFFWKYGEAEASMNTYLEEKFKDDFMLGDIRFDWRNGGSYYTYASAASTDSEFYVEVSKDREFSDGYAYEYWSYGGLWPLKPIVSKHIQGQDSVAVDLFFEENIMDFKAIPDNMEVIRWEVYVNVPFEILKRDETAELENVYSLLAELKANSFQLKRLEIRYIEKTLVLDEGALADIAAASELKAYLVENE